MIALQLRKFLTLIEKDNPAGWLESWEGLLLVTDVSTTCAEAIFKW